MKETVWGCHGILEVLRSGEVGLIHPEMFVALSQIRKCWPSPVQLSPSYSSEWHVNPGPNTNTNEMVSLGLPEILLLPSLPVKEVVILKAEQNQGLLLPVYVLHWAEHCQWLFFFSMNCSLPFSQGQPHLHTSCTIACWWVWFLFWGMWVSVPLGWKGEYSKISWFSADVSAAWLFPSILKIIES